MSSENHARRRGKVQEAGGSLSGGHSIADDSVKYGLSVTGTVHPDRIWQNNTGRVGDLLILTKPLGTGILCAAHASGGNPGWISKGSGIDDDAE